MNDDVECDLRRATANLKKHEVDFADAATVFHDEQAVTIREDAEGEERSVTIGMDALGDVLVVVYTWRRFSSSMTASTSTTPTLCIQTEFASSSNAVDRRRRWSTMFGSSLAGRYPVPTRAQRHAS